MICLVWMWKTRIWVSLMELWLSQNIEIDSSSKTPKSFTYPCNHVDYVAPSNIARYSTLKESNCGLFIGYPSDSIRTHAEHKSRSWMSLIVVSNPICINEAINSSISFVMIKNTKINYGLDVFEFVFFCLKVGFLWSNDISTNNPYNKCYFRFSVCQENELPYNSLVKSYIYFL